MTKATFKEERKLWRGGAGIVAGLDEVGRGPLAGPVVACAVVVLRPSKDSSLDGLRKLGVQDSKQLSPARREGLYLLLRDHPSLAWGLGRASERVVDRVGIQQTWQLAMGRAVQSLERKLGRQVDALIVDGSIPLQLPRAQLPLPRADQTVFSCAAASILAKVHRDRLMTRYHLKYPQYGFDRHKGYGTAFHLSRLQEEGPCEYHRKSFAPVARLVA